MSGDVARVRALAEGRGYLLVKGAGRIVGKRDYGRFGLKHATTGHEVMGFGNRGVTASLAEVERFLEAKASTRGS